MISSQSSPEEICAYLKIAKPILLPVDYLKFLVDQKGIQPTTLVNYKRWVGQFLKCCRLLRPDQKLRLEMVYEEELHDKFLEAIKCHYGVSTIPNYCHALISICKHLYINDREPANAKKIEAKFELIRNKAQREKDRHLAIKRTNFRSTSRTLELFYKRFYQGEIWKSFFGIAAKVEEKVQKKEDFKLSRQELRECNMVIIGAGTAYNGKRAANLSRLKFKATMKIINRALSKFRKDHPTEEILPIGGRLDRQKMAKAVLLIEECSKNLHPDHVMLINPRDVLAFQVYGKFIRPHGPKAPKTEAFLINSRGNSIDEGMSQFLTDLGRKLKIPDLSFTNLRKLLETRNLQDVQDADVAPAFRVGQIAAATRQIGHSNKIALKYYKTTDEEELTHAVNRLLFLLEDAGHKEWLEEEEEEEDEGNGGGEDHPDGVEAISGKDDENDDNWMSQVYFEYFSPLDRCQYNCHFSSRTSDSMRGFVCPLVCGDQV